MSELFEFFMVLCFGFSWPCNIYKSLVSRTARGRSAVFSLFVWVGYACGVAGKLLTGNITYVFVFYVINLTMVTLDIALYVRNLHLDRMVDAEVHGTEEAGREFAPQAPRMKEEPV